jgi:hypothetical protein
MSKENDLSEELKTCRKDVRRLKEKLTECKMKHLTDELENLRRRVNTLEHEDHTGSSTGRSEAKEDEPPVSRKDRTGSSTGGSEGKDDERPVSRKDHTGSSTGRSEAKEDERPVSRKDHKRQNPHHKIAFDAYQDMEREWLEGEEWDMNPTASRWKAYHKSAEEAYRDYEREIGEEERAQRESMKEASSYYARKNAEAADAAEQKQQSEDNDDYDPKAIGVWPEFSAEEIAKHIRAELARRRAEDKKKRQAAIKRQEKQLGQNRRKRSNNPGFAQKDDEPPAGPSGNQNPAVQLPGFLEGTVRKGWYREMYEGEGFVEGTQYVQGINKKMYKLLPESEWEAAEIEASVRQMDQVEKDKQFARSKAARQKTRDDPESWAKVRSSAKATNGKNWEKMTGNPWGSSSKKNKYTTLIF